MPDADPPVPAAETPAHDAARLHGSHGDRLATTSAPGVSPILHADAHWIVADKPAGLLSVPGRGAEKADCLWVRLKAVLGTVHVVHRLDMSTSGLMVFARDTISQRVLSQTFAARRVEKHYEAVVWGHPTADQGDIDLPLAADWPRRPLQMVDAALGKPSITTWRVLQRRDDGTTRLHLQPHTGRTHQLRVHLQAIGHPIVGDALYAPQHPPGAAGRLLLHACRLRLPHPARPADAPACLFESPAPF